METLSAAVIGSRTYPNSLSGSPLEFFLQSFIGELNPSSDYVSFDGIKNIPSVYADMKVALLSAATCTWRENSDNLFVLQNSTIVAMVEVNANEGTPVATELACKRMNIRNIKRKVTLERTMIIIDLESIYCNRYAGKAFAYKIIRRILLD